MSAYIKENISQNLFYTEEIKEKNKLITTILINIESNLKIIQKYKRKYFENNRNNIIINKIEFLNLLNEIEETISQSLRGMHSLLIEIKNLKEKKEYKDKFAKKLKEKIQNKSNHFDNELYFDYSNENDFSKYLDEITKNNNNKIGKTSFIQVKKLNLYKSMHNFQKKNNKFYIKKNKNNSSTNIISLKDIKKLNIANNSMFEKEPLIYDISLIKDSEKEQNQSSLIINYNDFKAEQNNNKNKIYNKNNRFLRLQIKNKSKSINSINENNLSKTDKNNSFSQKYELKFQNSNKENNERIEVEIKCPIRHGLRKNFKRKSERNENSKCNSIFNRLNYNHIRKEL